MTSSHPPDDPHRDDLKRPDPDLAEHVQHAVARLQSQVDGLIREGLVCYREIEGKMMYELTPQGRLVFELMQAAAAHLAGRPWGDRELAAAITETKLHLRCEELDFADPATRACFLHKLRHPREN